MRSNFVEVRFFEAIDRYEMSSIKSVSRRGMSAFYTSKDKGA